MFMTIYDFIRFHSFALIGQATAFSNAIAELLLIEQRFLTPFQLLYIQQLLSPIGQCPDPGCGEWVCILACGHKTHLTRLYV